MATRRVLLFVVVALVYVTSCSSLKLPSYIKPCSRDDPDLNACVLKKGKEAIAEVIKRGGDKKYNIPSLTPLLVTELQIDQNGLKLNFKNVKLNGIDKISLTKAMVDLKSKREEFELKVPMLEIICDYEVSGRILVLPIQGVGPANITIPNLKVKASHDFEFKKGKSGKDHIVTKNPTLQILGKPIGFIKMENLFGNKELSDNMNLIMNENSEEIIGEVGPAVAEAISLVIDQIYSGISNQVSYDDFYPVKV